MTHPHYTLFNDTGDWQFTSPMGLHTVTGGYLAAANVLAKVAARHREKADGDGPESEIFKPYFGRAQGIPLAGSYIQPDK